MNFRSITAGMTLAALAACGPAAGTGAVPSSSSSSSSSVSSAGGNVAYANQADGYTVNHPASWTVHEQDTLINLGDDMKGAAFVVPESVYTGTQLLDARAHIAVLNECPSYGQADMVTIGGRTFMHDTWSDPGAGNLYSGEVYMTKEGTHCAVITLFTHRCNLGPDCGPAHDRTFDDTQLEVPFGDIVKSFDWSASL